MSTISKLSIRGIRSFGTNQEDEQVSSVDFKQKFTTMNFTTFFFLFKTEFDIFESTDFDCRREWMRQDNNH